MTEHAALDCATLSHPGMVRSHNEDSVFVDGVAGIAILADGMGATTPAKSQAVSRSMSSATEFSPTCGPVASCRRSTSQAGLRMRHCFCSNRSPPPTRASTKPRRRPEVPAWHDDRHCGVLRNRVSIGHIGDSRCYRLRGEKLEQLTRDHSLPQEQIDSGQLTQEQAKFSLTKNPSRGRSASRQSFPPTSSNIASRRTTFTCSIPTALPTWSSPK